MPEIWKAALPGLVALPLLASNVKADVTTFAHVGAWEAFGGLTNDGTPVCGVSAEGGGRWFGLKYFKGDDSLTIQLSKDSWKVKNGTKITVTMQIDDEDPWRASATAFHMNDGDAALQFSIGSGQLAQWMQEFRGGNTLFIRFPNDNVEDWRADLTGSDAIGDAMTRCLRAMGE